MAVNVVTNGTHFTVYDGNGNVGGLMSVTDATTTAQYEYSPFGETLRATGPMARCNPIRFGTQLADEVTGNTKYLFRDYVPAVGRWPSRDPIGEDAFLKQFLKRRSKADSKRFIRQSLGPAYCLLENDGINHRDYLGLAEESDGCPPSQGIRDKCYQYACNNYGKYSDIPGARPPKKQQCDRPYECDEIREAAKRDGLIDVPPGGCPDGYHKVAYAIQDNKQDYHWLRESENGKSWCHKFYFYDKPSNLDGSRKVITDPSTANLSFPQIGRQPAGNYKFCKDGYLCAPNSWTDVK